MNDLCPSMHDSSIAVDLVDKNRSFKTGITFADHIFFTGMFL